MYFDRMLLFCGKSDRVRKVGVGHRQAFQLSASRQSAISARTIEYYQRPEGLALGMLICDREERGSGSPNVQHGGRRWTKASGGTDGPASFYFLGNTV